jgi:hypothetical protein
VRESNAADKDDRQPERAAGAVPGQIEDKGHRAGCRQFGQRHHIREPIECRKLKSLPRDDANRAENEQAADSAEKSADHRVGHVADRAAHPRQPETAEHDAGDNG